MKPKNVQINTDYKYRPVMIQMLFLILFFFIRPVAAETVYKIESTGFCGRTSSGSRISDKTLCEAQAVTLGLADTTATTMAMSQTLPGGCIFVVSEQKLYVFDSDNTNECTPEHNCLCAYTAPVCSAGVNDNDCICGLDACTTTVGLVCGSTCSHAEMCVDGLNTKVCQCGSQDCTPASGLTCSSETCVHAPECENRDGTIPNLRVCQCGLLDCVERYCDSGTCRAACPQGTYVTSNHQCEDCLIPGYFCPSGATQSPTSFSCPSGSYSDDPPISTALECKLCPVGTAASNSGNTNRNDCLVCTSNMYQDEEGQSSCKGCPNEKIIVDTTDANKHNSIDDCVVNIPTCSPLHYLQNNICTDCKAGFRCDGTSMSECPAGYYCIGDGTATPCPPGNYGEQTNLQTMAAACQKCGRGTFQTVAGQTYCARSCPLGTHGVREGGASLQEACRECPVGHKCGTLALEYPVLCPMGSFQPNVGSSKCELCPRNTFNDKFGMSACTPCVVDENNDRLQTAGIGSTSVSQCIQIEIRCPGAQRPIRNSCQNCSRGFYSNGLGTRCILCPSGFTQPQTGQYTCDVCPTCNMLGSSSDDFVPFEFETNVTKLNSVEAVYILNVVNISVYLSIGILITGIVAIHRCCPHNLKHLDLLFSGDHLVEDTHARRILDTRLGASLTLCVPFIVGAIVVFVFTDDNTTEQYSLVPTETVEVNSDFKNIYFEYHSYFANKDPTCDQVQVDHSMNCTQDIISTTNKCIVSITCAITNDFSGEQLIDMKIPDNQQWAALLTYATPWMATQNKFWNVLKSRMTGTKETPSVVSFGARKCKYSNIPEMQEQYGLQLQQGTTTLVASKYNSGYHYVQIRVTSAETFYLHTVDRKLGFVTQLSTVLTLLISVIGTMHTLKLCLEKAIDKSYLSCCDKTPEDILRRQGILEERTALGTTGIEMVPAMQKTPVPRHKTQIQHTRTQNPLDTIHEDQNGQKYRYNADTEQSEWVL